jgi:hypothetical protein
MLLENGHCKIWTCLTFVSNWTAAGKEVPAIPVILTQRRRVMRLSAWKVTITILNSGPKDANKTPENFRFQYREPAVSYNKAVN